MATISLSRNQNIAESSAIGITVKAEFFTEGNVVKRIVNGQIIRQATQTNIGTITCEENGHLYISVHAEGLANMIPIMEAIPTIMADILTDIGATLPTLAE